MQIHFSATDFNYMPFYSMWTVSTIYSVIILSMPSITILALSATIFQISSNYVTYIFE